MSSSDASPDRGERALDVYASFLERQETGETGDLDALIEEHPELEEELRHLHSDWNHVEGLLDRLGVGSVARRLVEEYGEDAALTVRLAGGSDPSAQLLERLADRSDSLGRYRIHGELARGGMGVILRAWDEDLHRPLAMKLLKGTELSGAERPSPRKLARFLEEAQVTAQLDHPGIPPVHELGLDSSGRVFFTMKLVDGETLSSILERVERREEGWTLTRAVGILRRVCEAMAYAHAKGVVHRDLKPSNVMVGRFGEVYVMDWGLAHIEGHEEHKDIRVRPVEPSRSEGIRSIRTEHRDSDTDSPLYTMDGDVIGTPAYMPPEQAAGRIGSVGPASDVYSVGSMLYELLMGHPPYRDSAGPGGHHDMLARIVREAPTPVSLSPRLPAELSAICERAMARDPADRYPVIEALGNDLQAYLEGRVVAAHRVGPLAKLEKWIRRKPAAAAALALALVASYLGAETVSAGQREARSRDLERWQQAFRNGEALRVTDEWGDASHLVARRVRSAELFRLCTELRPDHPNGWLRLAEMHERLHDREEAVRCLARAEALGAIGWTTAKLRRSLLDGEKLVLPSGREWMTWSELDQFGLAESYRSLQRPSDALRILMSGDVQKSPILVPAVLLGVSLHDDINGSGGAGPTLLHDREMQIDLALVGYDDALREIPEDPVVGYNRSSLIVDYVKADMSLDMDPRTLWDDAGEYFLAQRDEELIDHADGYWAKFKFVEWVVWKSPDSLADSAAQLESTSDERILEWEDPAVYASSVQALVCTRNYERAFGLLSKRNFDWMGPEGPMHMLLRIYEVRVGEESIDPDPEGLATHLEEHLNALTPADRLAAVDLAARLGISVSSR